MSKTVGYSRRIIMPVWFRIIMVLLLAWSLVQSYLFYITNTVDQETLAGLPANVRELYLDIPLWVTISGTIGIGSSIIGLILLILRKSVALKILIVAATGVVLRDLWFIIDGRVFALISDLSLITSSLQLGIYVIQPLLAYLSIRKGWL